MFSTMHEINFKMPGVIVNKSESAGSYIYIYI